MGMRDEEALFRRAVELFNSEDFFECHEVFEELWVSAVQPDRWFLQSLIHFAVGLYHYQRGNNRGALRQLNKGLKKIRGYLPSWKGIDTALIERQFLYCIAYVKAEQDLTQLPKIDLTDARLDRTVSTKKV
ncbi:MAG: hypothetical protein CMN58_07190 [Solibacterales bacterium]|nr:hypothetical protein [Bryobacterales bacterium]|tara:strand:- start:5412 stop:5804 length:393 start_codon:yes stop_codon:yes gene_type:complete